MPLKTNDYIHSFFGEHKGKEFVHFQSYIFPNPERIKYYYFFQEWAGKNNNFWHYADRALIELQKILHIKICLMAENAETLIFTWTVLVFLSLLLWMFPNG